MSETAVPKGHKTAGSKSVNGLHTLKSAEYTKQPFEQNTSYACTVNRITYKSPVYKQYMDSDSQDNYIQVTCTQAIYSQEKYIQVT